MKEKINIMEYLKKNKNPYQLKVGEMIVEMMYSENNKRFNECIQNILNEKSKKI